MSKEQESQKSVEHCFSGQIWHGRSFPVAPVSDALQEEDHALSNDCLGVFCYVVAYALMAGQNLKIVFGAIWVFALDIRWLRMSLNLLVLIPFTTPGVQVGEKKIYNDKSTLYSLEPCRNRLAKARANTLAIGP